MLSEALRAAGAACEENVTALLQLLERAAAGGPMEAMGSAEALLAHLAQGLAARRQYAELLEGEIAALDDRLGRLELATATGERRRELEARYGG